MCNKILFLIIFEFYWTKLWTGRHSSQRTEIFKNCFNVLRVFTVLRTLEHGFRTIKLQRMLLINIISNSFTVMFSEYFLGMTELGSLVIARTRNCTLFLKIGFVVARGVFYSYNIHKGDKSDKKGKLYEKNLVLCICTKWFNLSFKRWVQFRVGAIQRLIPNYWLQKRKA